MPGEEPRHLILGTRWAQLGSDRQVIKAPHVASPTSKPGRVRDKCLYQVIFVLGAHELRLWTFLGAHS